MSENDFSVYGVTLATKDTVRPPIVPTTANQWRLKEGAKNDRLKKKRCDFCARSGCNARGSDAVGGDARSAEHVIDVGRRDIRPFQ